MSLGFDNAHYNKHPSGVECIDVSECLPGNVMAAYEYVWRCDLKSNAEEDLRKARWRLARERAIIVAEPHAYRGVVNAVLRHYGSFGSVGTRAAKVRFSCTVGSPLWVLSDLEGLVNDPVDYVTRAIAAVDEDLARRARLAAAIAAVPRAVATDKDS